MAPSSEARKRKTPSEEVPIQSTATSKRLRSSRQGLENAEASSSSEIQSSQPAQRSVISSSSSTPRTSRLAVSPPPSSSVAGDPAADEESDDSLSPTTSSIMSEVPPWDPSCDMATVGSAHTREFSPSVLRNARTLQSRPAGRAKLSEQWRNATREPMKQTTDQSTTGASALHNSIKSFLDLPRELRDQIYREVYVHNGAIAIRQPKFHLPVLAYPKVHMDLMRTNSQIQAEAMAIFIGENSFVLDLNILTAIDFLAAMPRMLSQHFTSITLGKAIMSGYVRYELGMFDSSRMRSDLVKRLVYEWNLKTISIEVPDEHNPSANTANNNNNNNGANGANGANGGNAPAPGGANTWFNLSTFHSRHDYSWPLMRELVDVLLESGFETLRLVYASPLPPHLNVADDPSRLLNLYALSRILYLDDEYEVETQVKRIEMARMAGRRSEFVDRRAVERHVRGRRSMRQFAVGLGKRKPWERGTVIVLKRPEACASVVKGAEEKLFETGELIKLPGAVESVNMDL